MLKPQDIVLLLKLLADPDHLKWSQNQLALHLCMSPSEVNAGFRRLEKSGVIQPMGLGGIAGWWAPVTVYCEELLIFGVKYFLPAQLGEHTRGIATSYAAPIFEKKIVLGRDPIPVWPHAEGKQRGIALEPLYSSVPKSIIQHPDQAFYDLLALVDAIRQGRARERNMAIKLLKERLAYDK